MNTADFVIIGAGSAGCVLASRLSAAPAVMIAEKGADLVLGRAGASDLAGAPSRIPHP